MDKKTSTQLTAIAFAIDPSLSQNSYAFSPNLSGEQKGLRIIEVAVNGLMSKISSLEKTVDNQRNEMASLKGKLTNANKKIAAMESAIKAIPGTTSEQ